MGRGGGEKGGTRATRPGERHHGGPARPAPGSQKEEKIPPARLRGKETKKKGNRPGARPCRQETPGRREERPLRLRRAGTVGTITKREKEAVHQLSHEALRGRKAQAEARIKRTRDLDPYRQQPTGGRKKIQR